MAVYTGTGKNYRYKGSTYGTTNMSGTKVKTSTYSFASTRPIRHATQANVYSQGLKIHQTKAIAMVYSPAGAIMLANHQVRRIGGGRGGNTTLIASRSIVRPNKIVTRQHVVGTTSGKHARFETKRAASSLAAQQRKNGFNVKVSRYGGKVVARRGGHHGGNKHRDSRGRFS